MKVYVVSALVTLVVGCKANEPSSGQQTTADVETTGSNVDDPTEGDSDSGITHGAQSGARTASDSAQSTTAAAPSSHPSSASVSFGSNGQDSSDRGTSPFPRFQIAAGEAGTCAIDAEHRLHCWGDRLEQDRQWAVPEGEFMAVFARSSSMCAVDQQGSPACFEFVGTEVQTRLTGPVTRIATGSISCAVKADGMGYCVEPPTDTQFGGGEEVAHHLIPEGESVTEVDSGYFFACGLRIADGTAVCWGPLTQPDFTTTECTNSPLSGQADPSPGAFEQLDVGDYTVCALSERGEIECWGVGGAEDDPAALNCDEPFNYGQAVAPEGEGFRQVSVGVHHACAIDAAGSVQCWGAGTAEGCDGGACEQSRAPEGTFVQVASGVHHTCAMRADRTVECWGAPASPSLRAIPASLSTTR